MYQLSQGVQQDLKQSVAWLQKAADQGLLFAHLALGDTSEGAGDYQAAFASYKAGQAANRDEARAGMRRCLGQMRESRQKQDTRQGSSKVNLAPLSGTPLVSAGSWGGLVGFCGGSRSGRGAPAEQGEAGGSPGRRPLPCQCGPGAIAPAGKSNRSRVCLELSWSS
jgi:hypothetical protein